MVSRTSSLAALEDGLLTQWALRNKLINGNFDIWQRGNSFSAAGYGPDRWKIESINNMTVARGDAVPPYGKYQLYISALSASNSLVIGQALEEGHVIPLAGKKVTFSFMAGASGQQSITAVIQKSATANASNGGSGGWTTIASITVVAPKQDAQFFSLTGDVPSDGSANGIRVAFILSNVANSANIGIWGAQLEAGPIATPFEYRPLVLEAVLAQAYYEVGTCAYEAYGASGNNGSYWHPWAVRKRGAPTVAIFNASSGSNSGVPVVAFVNNEGFRPRAPCTTTGQQVWTCNYISDMEL